MSKNIKDFDNQYFRIVTISLINTLNKHIRWINEFENKRTRVLLPFYSPLIGDMRFIMDAFVDDIVDKRVKTNTDQYERGVVNLTGIRSISEELANPNQYLSKELKIDDKLINVTSKIKAVPLIVSYDIEIQLSTSNEIDKVSQKILNVLFNYKFFNFDYYGLKIDAEFTLPDDKTLTINRDSSLENPDRKKIIKFNLDVKTHYPIFRVDTDDLIVCDNDDDINWNYLGIPKPTNDFLESLKKYKEAHGIINYDGSEGNETRIEGETNIQKVNWNFYLSNLSKLEDNLNNDKDKDKDETDSRGYDPRGWNKEDF